MKRRQIVSSLSAGLLGTMLAPAFATGTQSGLKKETSSEQVILAGTRLLRVQGGPQRDRPYELLISLPAGKRVPEQGHPVLFILDGNAHFGAFRDAHRAQDAFAEAIVVAVGYPTEKTHDFLRRSYDYSPPAPAGSEPPQGGDREFLETLENVIIPCIEQHWHIDRGSMRLFGHSFGGMFALRTLFERSMLFTHYVSASPTLWWRDDYLLAPERAFVEAVKAEKIRPTHQSILIIIGALEAPQEVQDARSLQLRLEALSQYGLRSSFVLQPGEDHMSLPIAIAPEVLRQVFTARRI